jgi:hypothetical protein
MGVQCDFFKDIARNVPQSHFIPEETGKSFPHAEIFGIMTV